MLIDRFIAKQILIYAGMATATLSIVLVMGNVFREVCDLLVNHRVPLRAILEFVACAMPFCLTYTLPWGFLTAVFLVFCRMASDNELLTLHTCGIRIGRVCWSVFIIAVAFSLLCFWINAEINPRARLRMKRILHTLAVSTLLNDSASNRFLRLPDKLLYIGSQDAGRLQNIQIYECDEESKLEKVIVAKHGWLESLDDKDELVIHLEDVTTDDSDPAEEMEFLSFRPGPSAHELAYSISLFTIINKYSSTSNKSPGNCTLGELRDEFNAGSFRTLFLTEFNKRISLSLACLAFALIGVPLAILFHRK